MKICTKCKIEQSEDEFSLVHPAKQDGKRRPDCKACVRLRFQKYYSKNREYHIARMKSVNARAIRISKGFVKEYLNCHPCVDCGEDDPIVLDFDHVREQKVCDVSKMANNGYRLWRITQEIAKCEVRCANCHRIRHLV